MVWIGQYCHLVCVALLHLIAVTVWSVAGFSLMREFTRVFCLIGPGWIGAFFARIRIVAMRTLVMPPE